VNAHPTRPSHRVPAAEWWAPVLVDLAAIQRANTEQGPLWTSIEFTAEQPILTAKWPDGSSDVIPLPLDAGRWELYELLAQGSSDVAPPAADDHTFWLPEPESPPRLKYAWLLDALGSYSDAWYAYPPEPVVLLSVGTPDAVSCTVRVGRPSQSDDVYVELVLGGGEDMLGIAYTITAQAAGAELDELQPVATPDGRPAGRLLLP
jgi:hypothetical protein